MSLSSVMSIRRAPMPAQRELRWAHHEPSTRTLRPLCACASFELNLDALDLDWLVDLEDEQTAQERRGRVRDRVPFRRGQVDGAAQEYDGLCESDIERVTAAARPAHCGWRRGV